MIVVYGMDQHHKMYRKCAKHFPFIYDILEIVVSFLC